MLIQAGLEPKYKEEFWCEVISTATKLDNIMVRPERTKHPHTLYYGEDAKYARITGVRHACLWVMQMTTKRMCTDS